MGVRLPPFAFDSPSARRWRAGEGLSLADRLCLALGNRLDREVLTADTSWGTEPGIRQIR